MKSKNEVINIIKILKKTYPEAKCSLDFDTPFQMMVAVMLSAQCTDERVNKITPKLFKKYPTPEKMANASVEEISELVKSCGFYRNKSKNIWLSSNLLIEKYNGILPEDIKELENFPGVGRKSANVIMLEAFNKPQGIAVDTHVKRISNRLGLSIEKEPIKIEQDLLKQIPKEYLKDVNHIFIYFGRDICNSRKPKCDICPIKKFCDNNIEKKEKKR